MLTVPAPAPDRLDGRALVVELRAAGVEVETDGIVYDPAARTLSLDAPDTAKATVERVVGGHVPAAPAPDPQGEFRKAVEAATTLAALKAALLGTTGPGAESRRPDGR